MNLGLAALDSTLEIASRLRLQREICFLWLSHSCRIRILRVFIRVRGLILEVHLRTVNVRVRIGYDLKLVSDFVTHSSSCWSRINPVILLPLYLVRIHAACLIVNLLLFLCWRRFFQVLGDITQCGLADTGCDIRVAVRSVVRDCLLR